MGLEVRFRGAAYTPPGATKPATPIDLSNVTENYYLKQNGTTAYWGGLAVTDYIAIPQGATQIIGHVCGYKGSVFLMYTIGFFDDAEGTQNAIKPGTLDGDLTDKDAVVSDGNENFWGNICVNIPQGAQYIRCSSIVNADKGVPGLQQEQAYMKLYFT